MRKKDIKLILLALLVISRWVPAVAQEVKGNYPSWQKRSPLRDAVGIKGGFIAEGNIYINDHPYTNNFGLHGGVFFDIRVAKKFFISPTLDIVDVIMFQQREMLLDVSLAVKRGFLSKRQSVLWRPTFAAGFGYMADIGDLKLTTYLTLKSSCEVIFMTQKRYSYLLELGVLGMPAGGNSDVKVRVNPHLFLRAGVLY